MFWFNKKQPNTIFIDNREYDKGFIDNRPNRELHPDMIMDFRKLESPDNNFKLVVMDPPHLTGQKDGCRMTRTYGVLNKDTWREDIKKGFDECWRVVENFGIIIFKWNEVNVKRGEVVKVIGREPLFGNRPGGRAKKGTHWLCFMKLPQENKE